MKRVKTALVVLANGFDTTGLHLDSISFRLCLQAASLYRHAIKTGEQVQVVLPFYVNESACGVNLFSLLADMLMDHGVSRKHIVWNEELPSVNAIADGEVLLDFQRRFPGFEVIVIAPSLTADYFDLTYRQVFKRAGIAANFEILPVPVIPDLQSAVLYTALTVIMKLMPSRMFPLWQRLRAATDAKRAKGFTRTINER